ncbi:hypothetical protein ACFVWR_01390 [Leifsonia sp. NPDC058292]|uniref:hypothetical protein n=1 Tax=Leifsonia sp. NPDC058292 TaxID=3346428 RepID=UPI0036D8CDBD
MQDWVPIVVAAIAVIGTVGSTFLGRSSGKPQLDALKAIREQLREELEPAARAHLVAAEIHIAKRIELRYRRPPLAQSFFYLLFIYAIIWTIGWAVVYALLAFQPADEQTASTASIALNYVAGGAAALALSAAIPIAMQTAFTDKVASGAWTRIQNEAALKPDEKEQNPQQAPSVESL